MILYLQKENRLTDTEIRLVVAKGEGVGGGMESEFGVSRRKLLCRGWINHKVLLYIQHRELHSISCDKPSWRRIWKRMCIYV